MSRFVRPRCRAFTLIELLVVVAIIALLIAILLPALSRAKEQGRIGVCSSNLKGIGTAAAMYRANDSSNDFPYSIHNHYTHDGKTYKNWTFYTEFIWGGGMPDFDYTVKNWPYEPLPVQSSDTYKIEPRARPINPFIAPSVSWNRTHPKNDKTPYDENLPGTFKCPSDNTAWVPGAEAYDAPTEADIAFSTWKFWGSSYPINWYWPYYYKDAITGNSAEEGKHNPTYTDASGFLRILGGYAIMGAGAGSPLIKIPGLGSKMLKRDMAGGWEGRWIHFYENRMNECMDGARPPKPDGSPLTREGKKLVGWHKQDSYHTALFLDGHAAYRHYDTRFVTGTGWTYWPNKPWKDDWEPFNNN
jgi:prepilin-type N-terminal cleavage/methylation domain-containing protein